MCDPEDFDAQGYIDAINEGEYFVIRGRAQCWIAAKALKHTGLNQEILDDINGALKTHAFYSEGCEENEVSFGYYCVGDDEFIEGARSDVVFSLAILVADPTITREEFVAADELLGLLQPK